MLTLLAAVGFGRQSGASLLPTATATPSSAEVTVVGGADPVNPSAIVKIASGPDKYPGIALKPKAGKWDLSAFGHVDATVRNTGATPLTIALRVDNAGRWQDQPWDSEQTTISPGSQEVVRTIFGYGYGYKRAFALNPAAIVNMVVFATPSAGPQSFEIESVRPGGTPGERPPTTAGDEAVPPKPDGVLSSWGRVLPDGTASGAMAVSGPGGDFVVPADYWASVPAGIGAKYEINPKPMWDLSGYTDVAVTIRNTGTVAVKPHVRLETRGGDGELISPSEPIAPRSVAEIDVPFAHAVDLSQSGTPGQITSDKVRGIQVWLDRSASGQAIRIESIKATLRTADLPVWLGRRPPLPGDWVRTLDEEFASDTLNAKVWGDTGENWYDKATHWSKSDVVLGGGGVRLRYEKKTGPQNDDPKRAPTPYAAGYLDTFGHWAQRYGYFEAKMRLPRAPGLWPAFWMMPDRGPSPGADQGKRQDTANGGMEFDVMEHLTRWGPYRYNIAMHYDGYGKDHKALGSEHIYVRPDKDGAITCGLLWLPGEATYYCNGVEVLRWRNPRISNVPATIMFTLPSGGWDNNALDDAKLPSDFVIQYVRVWQRRDLLH